MIDADNTSERLNLRERVERLLPDWQSWYPSLFHAAEDLGLIRARVCAPSSLLLSNRHAAVQSEALQAFKDKWLVEDEPDLPLPPRLIRPGLSARRGPPPQKRLTKWRR
ncbi:MAG TPA: hypothetical protein VFS24_10270 [Steroidobacteraceae bacterium]|nr:hypothetical protein [Steroidobacteraceae bacterium]